MREIVLTISLMSIQYLYTDKSAMYSTAYDMQCRIRHNLVIKQQVQKISVIIKFISKWLIDHGILDEMDKLNMNQP